MITSGRFSYRVAVVSALAVALLACGGGGGGGGGSGGGGGGVIAPPSTPVAITSTNALAVAGESADSLMQAADSGALVTGTVLSGDPVAPQSLTRLLSSSAKRLKGLFDPAPSGGHVTAMATTQMCLVSGSFTIDQSSSTSATLTFDACSDMPGETVNGALSIGGITGSATNFSANVTIDVTVSSTGLPTLRTVGSFGISFNESASTDTIILSGSSLTLVSGSHTIAISSFNITNVLNTTTGDVDARGSYTIASTRLNGSVSVMTNLDFRQVSGRLHPSQGVLVVTGANNSHVRLTVFGDETMVGNQVQIEVDGNGDNAYDPPINTTWAALAGA
jgi:hypothetical protein